MAIDAQPSMADGIRAHVDEVQASVASPTLDGARTKPERAKLPERDHSVLPLGELGNGSVERGPTGAWAAFGLTMRPNAAHVCHGAEGWRPNARM